MASPSEGCYFPGTGHHMFLQPTYNSSVKSSLAFSRLRYRIPCHQSSVTRIGSHVRPRGTTLRWTKDQLTVSQLVQKYGCQLPIIVRATCGYHDVDGVSGNLISLAAGQVLQVYGHRQQTRVYGIDDSNGRRFSLPANCQLGVVFCQTFNCHITWSAVIDILRQQQQRKTISFRRQGKNKDISIELDNSCHHLPLLPCTNDVRLTHIETRNFLIGLLINEGWLCQDRVQWIPEELGAQFQVAIDLNESTNDFDAWNDYCSMFERIGRTATNNFSCNTSPPYNGVVYTDWKDHSPHEPRAVNVPAFVTNSHLAAKSTLLAPINEAIDTNGLDVKIKPETVHGVQLSDLNMTSSMTSLIQRGSCSTIQLTASESQSTRSSGSLLNLLPWKRASSKSNVADRQPGQQEQRPPLRLKKKTTPRIVSEHLKSKDGDRRDERRCPQRPYGSSSVSMLTASNDCVREKQRSRERLVRSTAAVAAKSYSSSSDVASNSWRAGRDVTSFSFYRRVGVRPSTGDGSSMVKDDDVGRFDSNGNHVGGRTTDDEGYQSKDSMVSVDRVTVSQFRPSGERPVYF